MFQMNFDHHTLSGHSLFCPTVKYNTLICKYGVTVYSKYKSSISAGHTSFYVQSIVFDVTSLVRLHYVRYDMSLSIKWRMLI